MNIKHLPLITLLISLFLVACSKQDKLSKATKKSTHFTESYEADWKEIEGLEKKGAGKSIIVKADDILKKSKETGNYPQLFKALAYRSKYINQIEEEATLKILNQYTKELNDAGFPLKSILHSALGELYFQYYNQNRWRFQKRTNTSNFEPTDLRTWSLDQIIDTVNYHYLAALKEKENLIQTPISHLNQILLKSEIQAKNNFDGSLIRSNLFDLLAFRALEYFKLGENRKNVPSNSFQQNQYPLFSDVSTFVKITPDSNDLKSTDRITLLLYQDLLKTANETQLIPYNLERLLHYYNESTLENKDSLYLIALKKIKKEYPSSSEITFAIADLYNRWGRRYNANQVNTEHNRWYLDKAHQLISTISETDTSYGYLLAAQLKKQIESKHLSFELERVYLNNEKILFKLNYKNIKQVFFRVIQSESIGFDENKNYSLEERVNLITQAKTIQEFDITLNTPADFQNHSAEIMTKENLTSGTYFLVVSTDKSFSAGENEIAFQEFSVSKLAFISRFNPYKNGTDLFVLDRETGAKISAAKVESFAYHYNYTDRKDSYVLSQTFTSNSEGYVFIPGLKKSRNIKLKITKGEDVLESEPRYFGFQHPRVENTSIRTHLFTDRAIYRPGQTVYYKGIVIASKKNDHLLKTEYTQKISLLDVNYQEVESISKRTNDYGSFEGSFTLPNSTLNGRFQLQTPHGSISIQVEEYKRPSFKINIDTLAGEPQLGKTIKVAGSIEAFAGNNINDAQINYRVTRKTSFPSWPWFRGYFPSPTTYEIKQGSIISDNQGKFSIDFIAIKDNSIDPSMDCFYNYEVAITAISPSGETQSFIHHINLSNKAFSIETNLKEINTLSDIENLAIACKNANGKPLNLNGELTLIALETPTNYSKPSYWEQADQQVYTKKELDKTFPFLHKEENSLQNLKESYQVSKSGFLTNSKLELFNQLKAGAYLIKIEIPNKDGKLVKFEQRFRVVSLHESKPSFPEFEGLYAIVNSGEPGDTAVFLISSSLENVKLLYEIEHDGKIVQKKWILVNNKQKVLRIPIEEKHRGGFSLHLVGVHSNRYIRHTEHISVPYSNKKLNLKLSSYRNKTKPGAKEKWTIEVLNNEQNPEKTEFLASMYDQSLDQFTKVDWGLDPYQAMYSRYFWDSNHQFSSLYSQTFGSNNTYNAQPYRIYPQLNWFGFSLDYSNYSTYYSRVGYQKNMPIMMNAVAMDDIAEAADSEGEASFQKPEEAEIVKQTNFQNPIRKNFAETVFFYPKLISDENGSVSFEFTMPDALTEWKFRSLAHSKSLQIGLLEQSIKTQKELMVFPNAPRFFREEDQLNFSVLVSNLSDSAIDGNVRLEFFNGLTNAKIDIIETLRNEQAFFIKSKENKTYTWSIKIPKNISVITYRVTAETEKYSDGEEKMIPVLLNRMLVTETLPLTIRGGKSKSYLFDNLLHSSKSTSLDHKSLTLELSPNPVWYAIQALPYLTESKSECSEQLFTRFYANAIAEKVANSNPKIKQVFDLWKLNNSTELLSKLEQNQELKSVLLEETPWLRSAKNETEQKSRIALLFDYNRMANELSYTLDKLTELQSPNGGWPWYKGMRDNRYMTQYIVSGLGHLRKLNIDFKNEGFLEKAIAYLDQRIIEDYAKLLKEKRDLSQNNITHFQIQYLYARSFFKEIPLPENKTAFLYYFNQAKEFSMSQSIYMKGMIALALHRYKPDNETSIQLLKSLEEYAILDEEMGMYWKNNSGGYYWYESKIETQALLIEAFDEITNNVELVEELKLWLLKQKQTQAWPSSKSSAEACYALLMRGSDLLNQESEVILQVGDEIIHSKTEKAEAGTGYFKKQWTKTEVKSNMGKIELENLNKQAVWGAIYWQYYQDLNQIKQSNDDQLQLSKTLFKATISASGETLIPIQENNIQIGDKIVSRIRLEASRDFEFIHLKDMRASGLEPIEVISGYRFQDGLGYYQTVKDASTNFFFDYLPKGVYVFEYATRATLSGSFSNGISSIQCLYAPEFTSHSQGNSLKIID
ncbi:MAG: hypothetical protein KDB74_03805 [Flavobacteriales bacterium]|nr:hypothetical protein [Flavobacteriales bacterium]